MTATAGGVAVAQRATWRGRSHELGELQALVRRARSGRSGTLVIHGEAGMGKTALVDEATRHLPSQVRVERIVAAESEMELAYAGLQQLCGDSVALAERLPAPQRDALETAFGLRAAAAPDPLLVGLAVLGLFTEMACDQTLLCVIDDAQWLDVASARVIAFVARRLDAEGIAMVLLMRTVAPQFSDLPQMHIDGLNDRDARELLRRSMPGPIDPRVRDQLITEARGNPLALRELPRALTPAQAAGGFAVVDAIPLEYRIEQSVIAQLDALPRTTRELLLVAAADPTGDPDLLRRASASLGLSADDFDHAEQAGALVLGIRVSFRHPLVRSAVYRAASPQARRGAHAALADATDGDRDPDRRAWHRACATPRPSEDVATELEQSAARARGRGGAAAAAAFLERAAELSPDPESRAERLIAAAGAKHDAGAPEAVLRLLDNARDLPLSDRQKTLIARLRARADYARRRHHGGARSLLAAAQQLEAFDPALARDTYIEALAAALYGGRLGDQEDVAAVATAILDATSPDDSGALDLLLRGQALLAAHGQTAAIPTLRRAIRALLDGPSDALALHWMWFASRAAQDLWDADALRSLAERQVELARAEGVLTVLPIALSLCMLAQTVDGRLDAADASCDEIDAIKTVTGNPLPPYGRMFLAAYRGQLEDAEHFAKRVRDDGAARREGYAVSAANFAEAILYNGLGRHPEALDAARRELPYTHELNHAMRTLLELIEAAVHVGDHAVAAEALERLASVTTPLENDWALGVLAMARAQLCQGDEAEPLFLEALERFERERIPIMIGRTQLLYGEVLRRQNRRIDAREQLRAAHEVLSRCGLNGFADRAARELRATGETMRLRSQEATPELTEQELNVARLAREGLTNRDIGARLFISSRTAEYHLRKVFMKLGINARTELKSALSDLD